MIQEARQILDEMPAFAAAFLLLVAMCIGVRCAVFYEADGEQLKLITDRADAAAMTKEDPFGRMHARNECSPKIPGFTVIFGVRQFHLELSVPVTGMQSLFENTRWNVVSAIAAEPNWKV
jgi:hypothetical protein